MGLSITNPAVSNTVTVNPSKFVTKANTAGQTNLSTNPYDAVTVTASTVSASYTSWVQYVASTASEKVITGITVKTTSTASTDFPIIVQIGVGGAGSEVAICDVPVHGYGTLIFPTILPTPLRITSGSRVAVRAYSVNTNGAGIFCALFGVPYANLEGN